MRQRDYIALGSAQDENLELQAAKMDYYEAARRADPGTSFFRDKLDKLEKLAATAQRQFNINKQAEIMRNSINPAYLKNYGTSPVEKAWTKVNEALAAADAMNQKTRNEIIRENLQREIAPVKTFEYQPRSDDSEYQRVKIQQLEAQIENCRQQSRKNQQHQGKLKVQSQNAAPVNSDSLER